MPPVTDASSLPPPDRFLDPPPGRLDVRPVDIDADERPPQMEGACSNTPTAHKGIEHGVTVLRQMFDRISKRSLRLTEIGERFVMQITSNYILNSVSFVCPFDKP